MSRSRSQAVQGHKADRAAFTVQTSPLLQPTLPAGPVVEILKDPTEEPPRGRPGVEVRGRAAGREARVNTGRRRGSGRPRIGSAASGWASGTSEHGAIQAGAVRRRAISPTSLSRPFRSGGENAAAVG